jgi:tRNA threonylcarbamoyladenosine biosynthesis protein TsaE
VKEHTWHSASPEATRYLAARLGRLLKPGDVVALMGELGAGKTEFVRGLAVGLDVPPDTPVSSPSFVLAHEYPGRLPLVHLDLYRLEVIPPELLPDLEDYLFGARVAAVEWAERLGELLPEHYLEVRLTVTGETTREITLVGHGRRGEELVAALAATPEG